MSFDSSDFSGSNFAFLKNESVVRRIEEPLSKIIHFSFCKSFNLTFLASARRCFFPVTKTNWSLKSSTTLKVGEYVGLDFGMVTEISDNEVKLRELIQDSAGDWSERESSLFLQGKEGSNK